MEKQKLSNNKKLTIILAVIISIVLITCLIVIIVNYILLCSKYNKAQNLYSNGEYEKAENYFNELKSFKDSENMVEKCNNKQRENWLNWGIFTFKLPYGTYNKCCIVDDVIHVPNNSILYIDDILKSIALPKGYRLVGENPGDSTSFRIKNITSAYVSYGNNPSSVFETLDLFFEKHGNYLTAKYITHSGYFPYKIHYKNGLSLDSNNEWHNNVEIKNHIMEIDGQYTYNGNIYDFTIKIIKN